MKNQTSGDERRTAMNRRRFLTAVGASSVMVGASGTALAQDDEEETTEEGEEAAETFVLIGNTEAWLGVDPEDIADEENPTLELEADETYEVIWENGDGEPHNFALLDEDEEELPVIEEIDVPEEYADGVEGVDGEDNGENDDENGEDQLAFQDDGTETPENGDGEGEPVSETITEEGEVQALQFTATEDMVEYYCNVHPTTMLGEVSFEGGDDEDGTETPEEE